MDRREFLSTAAGAAAAVTIAKLLKVLPETTAYAAGLDSKGNAPLLPRRPYGKTGVKLSIIGLGGIVVMRSEQKRANRVVAEAVEKGVNYFDVAPTYGDAELKLAPALQPFRKKSFLACKTTQRKRDAAQAELRRSLKRLRTDHLDLYQLHALTDLKKDVDVAFARGGAMEAFVEAKKAGVVRYLGFSAHSVEAALAAMDRFDFDSVLFPINFSCFHRGRFGQQVIEKAKTKNVARLALKPTAREPWPSSDHAERKKYAKCWYRPLSDTQETALALRFALSQPVTAAIPPAEESLFRLAVESAMNFKPLTAAEQETVKTWAMKVRPLFSHTPKPPPRPNKPELTAEQANAHVRTQTPARQRRFSARTGKPR